jgi:hypothetical protein
MIPIKMIDLLTGSKANKPDRALEFVCSGTENSSTLEK